MVPTAIYSSVVPELMAPLTLRARSPTGERVPSPVTLVGNAVPSRTTTERTMVKARAGAL